MDGEQRHNHCAIIRSSVGPSAAEALPIIAIATILITRLFSTRRTYQGSMGGGCLALCSG